MLRCPTLRSKLTPRCGSQLPAFWRTACGIPPRVKRQAQPSAAAAAVPLPFCRPSPFVVHNNYGGGFVSDEDRVMLQSLIYASPASAGEGDSG